MERHFEKQHQPWKVDIWHLKSDKKWTLTTIASFDRRSSVDLYFLIYFTILKINSISFPTLIVCLGVYE